MLIKNSLFQFLANNSAIIAGGGFITSNVLQVKSGVEFKNTERQIAGHGYNLANLALFLYGFEKKASVLKKFHLLPIALLFDMGASLVSAKASYSDKTTENKQRPFELGKALATFIATVILTIGIYKDKKHLRFFASGLYVAQAFLLTLDGLKEKDNWNLSTGLLSTAASFFMAFIKK